MTAPRWDAERFHREMMRKTTPAPGRRKPRRWVIIAAAALMVVSVVSAQQLMDDDGPVGVCHATGSDTNPYRFLIVNENGYEHAHHRHHEHDFFVDAALASCDRFEAPPEDGNETTDGGNATAPEAPTGNETTDAGDETGPEPATNGNDTADGNTTEVDPPAGNETAPPDDDGAGNTTDAGDAEAGDGTAAGETPDGNQTTAPDNTTGEGNATDGNATFAPPEPLPPQGDVSIRQRAQQDQFEVLLTLDVHNIGDAPVRDVFLQDTLPDIQRAWLLVDAQDQNCVLDGNDLQCFFGDMDPSDEIHVHLRAYTDRMPCGQDATNTAFVTAEGDGEDRNNAASAGIAARSC